MLLVTQIQTIWTTVKIKSFVPYFLALGFVFLFFAFEFIPEHSYEYNKAHNEFNKLKKENSIALKGVKEYAKGSAEYDNYVKVNNKKNIAYKKAKELKELESFMGFKNKRTFTFHFSLGLLLFVYGTYNLIRSFYYERRNVGNKVLHSFIIGFSFFKLNWVFQKANDYNIINYLLFALSALIILVYSVYLITKYKKSYINKLKGDVRMLSRFTILNTKASKTEEAFKLLEDLADSQN